LGFIVLFASVRARRSGRGRRVLSCRMARGVEWTRYAE